MNPESGKTRSRPGESRHADKPSFFPGRREAAETLRAIRQGAVDAFVVEEERGRQHVVTLEGADRAYRMFVEQMPQGVATLHPDGTLVYANRSLSEFLGAPHETLAGSSLSTLVPAEDHGHCQSLLELGKSGCGRGELRLKRADGALVPVHLTFSRLPEECGDLIALYVGDLTAQKGLTQAEGALREADRRKDEFLAILGHELRGSLAPLVTMLEVMKRSPGDEALIEQARSTMERQLRQLVRLADDLLDVSRITRGTLELRKERVELGAILRRVVGNRPSVTKGAAHETTLTLPDEPIFLDADPARLTQVFSNLYDNACKYTEPGGRIWIRAELSSADCAEAVVTVRDTGVGIPADRLASVFDVFMQVEQTRSRSQGGLGIGLALVKRLVEMHGGGVAAASAGPGKGSEFVIRLPAEGREPEPSSRGTQPEREGTRAKRRFLVVDDNADICSSLAMLLVLEGHEVRTARDGEEALELAARWRPDAVVLDIALPKLNGFDAARRMRSAPWGKTMVLIAMTGWGQEEDRRKSEEAGFDGHLVKPVDFAALMELLDLRLRDS